MFWRRHNEELEALRAPPDRSWPTRIAWGVLIGGFALILTRASVATLVRVHGEGMDPTITDGDGVLLVRSTLALEAGDIVVYDPTPPPEPIEEEDRELPGDDDAETPHFGQRDGPGEPLPNTAVVDVEGVEKRWGRLSTEDGPPPGPPASYRIGRVLAVPGDAVSFNVPDVPLGLAVNGESLRSEALPHDDSAGGSSHLEIGPAGPYRVHAASSISWPGMALPSEDSPVQLRAEGYLVIADNRDESACCDSRALGWIVPERIRGEIAMRIRARAPTTREGQNAKRVEWLP